MLKEEIILGVTYKNSSAYVGGLFEDFDQIVLVDTFQDNF